MAVTGFPISKKTINLKKNTFLHTAKLLNVCCGIKYHFDKSVIG